MLDFFRQEVVGETLNAYLAKFFDNYAAADWLSEKLLTSSSLMEPITTFAQHENYTAVADKNAVFSKASKMELMAAKNLYGNIIE